MKTRLKALNGIDAQRRGAAENLVSDSLLGAADNLGPPVAAALLLTNIG
jgi:hypothetical protein